MSLTSDTFFFLLLDDSASVFLSVFDSVDRFDMFSLPIFGTSGLAFCIGGNSSGLIAGRGDAEDDDAEDGGVNGCC